MNKYGDKNANRYTDMDTATATATDTYTVKKYIQTKTLKETKQFKTKVYMRAEVQSKACLI